MTQLLRNRRGFALEASLVLLVLIAALIGAAVLGSMMVQRSAGVDYRGSRVNYAAEAGADNVMAQLQTDMSDGIVTSAELAALTAPTLPGFTVTTRAALVGGPVPQTISSGPYTGLIGINQRIDISVSATDALRNRSDAVVGVNAQSIPLFQFGVFYEGDLEIHNGPPMTFAGWVHTNSNLYLSASPTFYQDLITSAKKVIHNKKWGNQVLGPVNINDANGVAVPLTFDSRSAPTAATFGPRTQADFDSRLLDSVMGVTPLSLPLPTGMAPIELIKPRNVVTDSAPIQAVKMAWKADYHIVVDLNLLATPCAPGAMTVLPRAIPTAAECLLIFQGRPNAFMDGREDVRPDLLDINVGELMNWINANPGARATSILYVTFINTSAFATARDFPAVRLYNGRILTQPITFASDRPVYVWKNYNDIGWQPSAIMGDAVTFLSNEWADAQQANFVRRANATPMWVYAAIAAGHSSTPCDWFNPGCPGGSYGGGLENFPRFLEDWGGSSPGARQMHYRGSLVSLFDAQYARLHLWNWRGYYNPPDRDWQFDTRFRNPAQLPPGTPTAGNVAQIAFRPVY